VKIRGRGIFYCEDPGPVAVDGALLKRVVRLVTVVTQPAKIKSAMKIIPNFILPSLSVTKICTDGL
jgi:hypothetical protein